LGGVGRGGKEGFGMKSGLVQIIKRKPEGETRIVSILAR
jgi:hypothetical protein